MSDPTVTSLAELVADRTWLSGSRIFEAGKSTNAALYFVRSGNVTIQAKGKSETKTIGPDGFFGDDLLLADVGNESYVLGAKEVSVVPKYTVTVSGDEAVTCGVLTLAHCRKILDTRGLGKPAVAQNSIVSHKVQLTDLKRHKVLGAGTFGIVFLVSRYTSIGQSKAYALKVQSKYELCSSHQAHAVVYEKEIMARLHHPFLIGLVQTYQDKDFVYILLDLVQGGELYSYIHTPSRDFLPEPDSRFYAACIAEGLGCVILHGLMVSPFFKIGNTNLLSSTSSGLCIETVSSTET